MRRSLGCANGLRGPTAVPAALQQPCAQQLEPAGQQPSGQHSELFGQTPLIPQQRIVNDDGTPTFEYNLFLTAQYEWERRLLSKLTGVKYPAKP